MVLLVLKWKVKRNLKKEKKKKIKFLFDLINVKSENGVNY